MSELNPIVCIQCGHQVQDPPVLNLDASGRNCRTCADRVLDAQPGLMPADLSGMEPSSGPKLVLLREDDDNGGDDWRPEPA